MLKGLAIWPLPPRFCQQCGGEAAHIPGCFKSEEPLPRFSRAWDRWKNTQESTAKPLRILPAEDDETAAILSAPLVGSLRFVAVRCAVMHGGERIATARSKTMAKRIARALNQHKTTREGV